MSVLLGEFDKQKFAALLKKAAGKPARSINEYGRQSGVSGSYISRLQQKLVNVPPGAEVIKKLAACAANGVTYYQLMIAAGHLPDDNKNTARPEDNEWREAAADHIVKSDLLSGRAKKIEDLPASELTMQLKQLGVELISLPHETGITEEQMKEIISTVKKVIAAQKHPGESSHI